MTETEVIGEGMHVSILGLSMQDEFTGYVTLGVVSAYSRTPRSERARP